MGHSGTTRAAEPPDGDVAVARVDVEGDGDATLLVNPDDIVTGDALSRTTKTLLGQIHF